MGGLGCAWRLVGESEEGEGESEKGAGESEEGGSESEEGGVMVGQ